MTGTGTTATGTTGTEMTGTEATLLGTTGAATTGTGATGAGEGGGAITGAAATGAGRTTCTGVMTAGSTTRGSGSNFVAAICADWAKRSSSSGLSAPSTSSASRLRLRTSLSLKAKGQDENASSTPMTRRRPQSGTATMERAPSLRQARRFTRVSVSVSSQVTICAARKQAPENAESRSILVPRSGRISPAKARKTISSFSASAMARPSAPVMATARSATNCNTSSRTNCSSGSNSVPSFSAGDPISKPGWRAARAFLRRTCSCRAENASKACSASRCDGFCEGRSCSRVWSGRSKAERGASAPGAVFCPRGQAGVPTPLNGVVTARSGLVGVVAIRTQFTPKLTVF